MNGGDQTLALEDRRTISRLRSRLDELEYCEPRVQKILAQSRRPLRGAAGSGQRRRLRKDRALSTLVRLFLLGVSVTREEAEDALTPLTVGDLAPLGLLEEGPAGVRARVRLVPHDGLILACDRWPKDATQIPPDIVGGVTQPSVTLARLTVRQPIASALDVGTGSGVQALLAARHARHVIATDLNPRALHFTAFNARLNGMPHVECRQGALFEPVKGRRFDLIVSNPPYVISPEHAFQYRDGGQPGDAFCRTLVQQAAAFLAEGGIAHILCHWVCQSRNKLWQRLLDWVEGEGFDAWLLHFGTYDPSGYAKLWNKPLRAADPGAYADALDRWLGYYRRHRIQAIASGAIILRRRSSGPNWVRADVFPGWPDGPAGNRIVRIVETQDYLSALPDERALLQETLTLAKNCRVKHPRSQRRGAAARRKATLSLQEGLRFEARVGGRTLELLRRCDGRRTLADALNDLAETTGRGAEALATALLPGVRELVRQGLLGRVSTGRKTPPVRRGGDET